MTKKDYISFANMLKVRGDLIAGLGNRADTDLKKAYCAGQITEWKCIVMDCANVFAKGNARFDKVRFYEACGMKSED